MTERRSRPAADPQRLTAVLPPSLLIVGRNAELRSYLRASLQQWYQPVDTGDNDEVVQHLRHCPPRGLIAGQLAAGDKDPLISALRDAEAPPVLKLWAERPPAGWADAALRHPFTRGDLLRAVDRLVHGAEREPPRDAAMAVDGVQMEANVRS